jgi:putative ABC transport system permease protein
MRNRYILVLAFKNLIGHKMRTILTAGGVAISVGFVVFLVSLGLGLQQISTNQIANIDALKNLEVTPGKSKIINVNDDSLHKFSTLSNVTEVEASLSNPAEVSYNGSSIDVVAYGKNSGYINLESPKYLIKGAYSSDIANEAIVNSELLNRLGIKTPSAIIGKEISIQTLLKSDSQVAGSTAKKLTYQLKVVGVIDDKTAPYLYLPLNLFIRDGLVNYTEALVRVKTKDDVDKVKAQVENLGYQTSSIKQTVDQINQFFAVFQVILLSFGGISIIVACLGVFNTLTISLLEKTREVGFMKALGSTRVDIYKLFIAESLTIGLMGSVVGITSGYLLGNAINLGILGLAKATGNQAVALFYMPMQFVLYIIATALLISFLTGLYPAFRAARINPLDALRYE